MKHTRTLAPHAKKVAILGAGNTGGAMAHLFAQLGWVDLVLYDVFPHIARGKALDLADAGALFGSNAIIIATDRLEDTRRSDIVIITAGSPRKPGQSREELAAATATVIAELAPRAAELSPHAIFIGFTNPMDAMTQLTMEAARLPKNRIVGEGGALDSARFRRQIADELSVPVERVRASVLGPHTDTHMVPIVSRAKVGRKLLASLLSTDRIDALVSRTKNRGAEILQATQSGSAVYAPAHATVAMALSILLDEKRVFPASALCEGEYGITRVFTGVPVVLGKNGVEEIIQWPLSAEEMAAMHQGAEATKTLLAKVHALRLGRLPLPTPRVGDAVSGAVSRSSQ